MLLGVLRIADPNLYVMDLESNSKTPIMSGDRFNVKDEGNWCIFMFVRADQMDPSPGEMASDTLGQPQKENPMPDVPPAPRKTTWIDTPTTQHTNAPK